MATNRQEGFFQRNLPKMGFALNTVTSVASGVVDLVAARIVSKSAGAGLAAGVLGTVSGIVVNWLIFLFSNVQEDYAEMGKVLDEKLSSQGDLIRVEEKKTNQNKTSYGIIFAQIGLSGAVLITTGLNAVSQYQEIQSLASSARDEGMDCPAEAAFWFGLCLAAMNGTSDFLTCNSFANLAIASIISKKSREIQIDHKHNDIESNEHDEILGSEGPYYQTFGSK